MGVAVEVKVTARALLRALLAQAHSSRLLLVKRQATLSMDNLKIEENLCKSPSQDKGEGSSVI